LTELLLTQSAGLSENRVKGAWRYFATVDRKQEFERRSVRTIGDELRFDVIAPTGNERVA
jgi:hypothetical protein